MWRHRARRVGWFAAATVASVIVGVAGAEAGGDGYVAAGGGRYANDFASGTLRQLSAGGERRFGGHFGVGGDGSLTLGGGDIWVASALHANVHIREHNRAIHLDPFVRGGYSRLSFLSESGGTNALNVGGGVNYWFSDNRAWVVELRAVRPMAASRYWIASAGFGFR
jgi:hypothetical protein